MEYFFICFLWSFMVGGAHFFPYQEQVTSSCGYSNCPKTDPSKINVHIVPHTHDDVGWLKTPDEYFYGDKNYIQNAGVQYILDTVIQELVQNPNRRFIYVETSFFYRWWTSRDSSVHKIVQQLVQSGQLEFIGGGWCMNDEAGSYYVDTIDQMTWGFRFLNDTFGPCAVPKVAWQIDPFGHARETASLFAQMGFDGLFFSRLDYQDRDLRLSTKTMELVWNASANLGSESQLFTGILYNGYGPPSGFCFDVLCTDEPIKDNPNLKGYNVDKRVDEFLGYILTQAAFYTTNNIILTMGSDFHYSDARTWFLNLDKLINYTNARQSRGSHVNVFYSTPSCYLKALNDAGQTWTVKTDDFFPYASDPHAYWTGYFTSRPALKGYIKTTNNILQIAKQLTVFANLSSSNEIEENLEVLKRYQGDAQHHDAVSGTSKQAVAYDYAQSLAFGVDKVESSINNASAKLQSISGKAPPAQEFCPYLNVSYCNGTEERDSFVLTLYNPLGHNVNISIRIPVSWNSYKVTGPEGNDIINEIQPIPHQVMTTPEKQGNAQNDLVFSASVPACGFASYFVEKSSDMHLQANSNLKKKAYITRLYHQESLYHKKNEISIQNEYLKVLINDTTGLLASITDLKTKKVYNVSQNFYYYPAMAGYNRDPDDRASGAYIFRPNGTEAFPVETSTVLTTVVGSSIQQTFNSYVSQVISLYPGENWVEFEWLVGPIPVGDRIGKEIISRFTTNFTTNGFFYTDSNGREILERKRNYRPTWTLDVTEPVSCNYYPVNSRIFIKDTVQDSQLTVITDRSQGGASIQDGQIELMVHRRLLYDDGFGVDEPLNEPGVDGKGLIVRGKHRLLLTSIANASVAHRPLGLAASFPPLVTVAPLDISVEDWRAQFRTNYSGLSSTLPKNINLVTLEPWKNNTILLRLENYLEKSDYPETVSPLVTVNMQNLLSGFEIIAAKETTLGAHIWLSEENRLFWNTDDNHVNGKSQKRHGNAANDDSLEVTLNPMQIRTFIVQVAPNQETLNKLIHK